jgi:hypothetical protein
MWVWVAFAYLIPALAITLQMLSPSDPQSQRLPQAVERKVAGLPRNDVEAEVL